MFAVGDKIAHPMHGAGTIEGIEERKINGQTRKYYVLKIPVGGMVVMVPQESTDAVGIRAIVTPEEADEIIASLAGLTSEMTQNWNKRYRENMMRIKSGDLLEVARVIKGLLEREEEKGLSTGERKMLRAAKQIFMSELVRAKNMAYEEIEDSIKKSLA